MTTIKRMTRREALKNLGLLATGAFLLGSSDVLTSCSSDNGKKHSKWRLTFRHATKIAREISYI